MTPAKNLLFILGAMILICFPADCYSQDDIQSYYSYDNTRIFIDNFDDNNKNWTTSDDDNGKLKIESGKFFIKRHKASGSSISIKNISIDESSDFIIETEVKKISGIQNNGYGIAWGASNDNVNDYFQFIVTGDGYYQVAQWQNGEYKTIISWTKSSHVNKSNGSRNKLSIVKDGSNLKFYINENYVNKTGFRKFMGDRFGFLVCNDQAVAFDYFNASSFTKSSDIHAYYSYNKKELFNDNFHDNNNNWTTSDDDNGLLKIESRQFLIKRHKSSGASISLQKVSIDTSSDFIIETEVEKISGIQNNGYGIAWGASNDNVNDYFQFIITADGHYQVAQWQHGKYKEIINWIKSSHINQSNGSRNKLSIVKDGSNLKFFINSNYVNKTDFQQFMGDRAGFLVCDNQGVAFDYFKSSSFTKNRKKIKNRKNDIPEIIITEPELKRAIKRVTTKKIKVAGRAKDSDGIYEVMINGIEAQLQSDGRFSAYIPLAVGENSISVTATDRNMKSGYKKFSISRKGTQFVAQSGNSEKRLALIIGNSNYIHGGKLPNPVNDARSMKRTLEKLNFTVIKYENSSQKAMKRAIDEFGRKMKNHNVGLFFYAGHGLQVNGNNYLIPVDAKMENENDVKYDTVRAGRVLAKMESAGSKTNIIILDACRDNPFERSWRRGTKGSGLAFMNAPSGSIIAYATSPGNTASDGFGNNGLYTSAILKHIQVPNITIEQMFKRVRSTIMELSGEKQVPWESTSLRGDFYFNK